MFRRMDPKRIAEHMAQQSTEELLAVAAAPDGEFEAVAIALAKEELGRRAVPLEPTGAPELQGARCSIHTESPALGTCGRCGRFICFDCRWPSPGEHRCRECATRAPSSPLEFGGWLVLAMLALFATPLIFAAVLFGFVAAVQYAGWAGLAEQPHWLAVNLWNLGSSLAMAGLAVFILPSYLGKRVTAPRRMQLFFIANTAMQVGSVVINAVAGAELELAGVTLSVAISAAWIHYFQSGKRVKETFIVPG